MTTASVNGIEIFYEERGGPDDPAILLIMGLGAQMTVWPDEFIDDLVSRGHRVVWFDNRDVGLSTKFHDVCPNADEQIAALFTGGEVTPPYHLTDMADDAVGLLDHLAIDVAIDRHRAAEAVVRCRYRRRKAPGLVPGRAIEAKGVSGTGDTAIVVEVGTGD